MFYGSIAYLLPVEQDVEGVCTSHESCIKRKNVLAEQFQVSRGTLRQAMLLLQEDGLISNHQGKGNIVLSNQNLESNGLEKVGNPIVDFCVQPIDRAVTSVGFQPPTRKHQEVLKLRPSSIVAVIDITYYSKEAPVGFAMVYMPHEILDEGRVDLENTDSVYEFYSQLLASNGIHSDTRLRIVHARERLADILHIPQGDPLLILEEELYTEYDRPVLSQKLYMGADLYEISLRRKNK